MVTAVLAFGFGAVPAQAATKPAPATTNTTNSGQDLTPEMLSTLGITLKASKLPRVSTETIYGEMLSFTLQNDVKISFTYDASGNPIVSPEAASGGIQPRVSVGADPFPYVSLDNAEQTAALVGSVGVATAICAVVGPETWGAGCVIGGAVVGAIFAVVAAHGVCPAGQNMRIYTITHYAQCRTD
jgi:hypothetical protein